MNIFRRNSTSHEESLRHEAGLINRTDAETNRTFGAAALSTADGPQYEADDDTYASSEQEDEDDQQLKAEVTERAEEIEKMSIDELLADSADSIARAEVTDDEFTASYYLAYAAAISTRALVLQLQLKKDN